MAKRPWKLVSWNVNGIRACGRKGFSDVYADLKADLFAVQETKAHPEQVDMDALLPKAQATGQAWASAQRKGYSGTCVFTPHQSLELMGKLGMRKYDNEGRGNLVLFDDFALVNLYYPNGAASDERHWFKMGFLDDILKYYKKLERKYGAIVACGDYNIAHTEHDIHDPKSNQKTSGFLPEERGWMDKLSAAGFTDTFRLLHPDARDAYSWWSYRQRSRERNKGWRLDYFFVSDSLRARVKKAEILTEIQGSDHCPVVVRYRLP